MRRGLCYIEKTNLVDFYNNKLTHLAFCEKKSLGISKLKTITCSNRISLKNLLKINYIQKSILDI